MLSLQGSATQARLLSPGLALAGVAVAAGFAANSQLSSLSALTVALLIGAVLGNLGLIPSMADAGLRFAARHLLRAGIVLLGLQLSLREVAHLGGKGFVAVIAVVIITFFGTRIFENLLEMFDRSCLE